MIVKKLTLLLTATLIVGMMLCPPSLDNYVPLENMNWDNLSTGERLFIHLVNFLAGLHLFIYRLGETDLEMQNFFWDIFTPRFRFLIGVGTLLKYFLVFFGMWSLGIIQGLIRQVNP